MSSLMTEEVMEEGLELAKKIWKLNERGAPK